MSMRVNNNRSYQNQYPQQKQQSAQQEERSDHSSSSNTKNRQNKASSSTTKRKGSRPRSSGQMSENASPYWSHTRNNIQSTDDDGRSSDDWQKIINNLRGIENGNENKNENKNRNGSNDHQRPEGGRREDKYNGDSPARTSSDWSRIIQNQRNNIGPILNSERNGMMGPFTNRIARNGWASNVIFGASSNSQHTVGWMEPNRGTAMGQYLDKALKNSPSLVDAMRRFSGRPYPGFPRNAKALYWNADKVGGDNYFSSPLRFSKNTQNGKNPTKNIFVGVSGGPERAFGMSIDRIADTMKKEFNTTNFVYHRGRGNAQQQIARAFSKIRDYAKANPDKPISVAFMLDTHGNTSGGGRAEGSGHGYTGQINERQLKSLVNNYLGGLDNVGIHMIISACHSGAFLAQAPSPDASNLLA